MRHFLSLAACLLASTLAAHADQYRLDFLGNQYQTVYNSPGSTNPYTLTQRVAGYFNIVTSGPLQANMKDVAFTTTGYSLNDGLQTLTNLNSTLSFSFDTSFSGLGIGLFTFEADKIGNPNDYIYVSRSGTRQITAAQIDDNNRTFSAASGVFTVSTTPEPSSFFLLGTGIVAAAGVVRRRLA